MIFYVGGQHFTYWTCFYSLSVRKRRQLVLFCKKIHLDDWTNEWINEWMNEWVNRDKTVWAMKTFLGNMLNVKRSLCDCMLVFILELYRNLCVTKCYQIWSKFKAGIIAVEVMPHASSSSVKRSNKLTIWKWYHFGYCHELWLDALSPWSRVILLPQRVTNKQTTKPSNQPTKITNQPTDQPDSSLAY